MHTKFAEIPELVTLVAHDLTTQDLFACVQVSSQWHHIFVPFLWHTIDDYIFSWKRILYQCGDPGVLKVSGSLSDKLTDSDKNKDRDWLMHIFRKHGHHICDLTIHWPMILEAASTAALGDTGAGGGCLALRSRLI
ncbi:hypothetical protein BGZ82_011745 [Podila clonocystis]|nr:hypothetical protein BGZ82_011745 [Podila clonocystis]